MKDAHWEEIKIIDTQIIEFSEIEGHHPTGCKRCLFDEGIGTSAVAVRKVRYEGEFSRMTGVCERHRDTETSQQ